ncbi:MAG: cell division protein ZapA [Bacteroidetes bacterium]|nr:cell division protein ZapA [Bacteroidota bacterium]
MNDKLSIKVSVAGRIYPLAIERDEEENVRKAVKLINEKVSEFEKNFDIKDRTDLLAMTALYFVPQYLESKDALQKDDKGTIERLEKLDKFISAELEKA